MTFLIDGYNLMHAVGLLGPGSPAGGLERARTRLLDWLADKTAGRAATLHVVFDAQKAPGPSPEAVYRGVWVRFAFRQTADELIEKLLAAEQYPTRVTVVSNDNQVRDAARRRGSAVYSSTEFVDWCIAEPNPGVHTPGSPQAEKPDANGTADEMAAWLAAFSQPKPKRGKR